MIRWLLGGLVGSAVGVVIWVLVGYFGHREVGWIAWAVGFLAGVGVRYAAYLAEQDASAAKGIVASAIAIGAILLAKFFVFFLLVGPSDDKGLATVAELMRVDDEAMVAAIANELAEQAAAKGQKVAWPPGVSPDNASKKADYPPAIWRRAEAQWKQLGTNEQEQRKRQRLILAATMYDLAKRPSFGDFFSPWDLLWFGLAIVTAYKIGAGLYTEE